MAKNKAIFLDRDGVLNLDTGYVYEPEKLIILPKVGNSLSILRKKGYKLIVITNQSGVGRGRFNLFDVYLFHRLMQDVLLKSGVAIDGFYICPHHKEANDPHFLAPCSCRKPKPGLLDAAIKEHDIDPLKSYFIGDKTSDIECGKARNIKTFQVRGSYDLHKDTKLVSDLSEACSLILKD